MLEGEPESSPVRLDLVAVWYFTGSPSRKSHVANEPSPSNRAILGPNRAIHINRCCKTTYVLPLHGSKRPMLAVTGSNRPKPPGLPGRYPGGCVAYHGIGVTSE